MNLISYTTNETIRTATIDEALESIAAARIDGGAGIIEADGIACYVDATEADVADEPPRRVVRQRGDVRPRGGAVTAEDRAELVATIGGSLMLLALVVALMLLP